MTPAVLQAKQNAGAGNLRLFMADTLAQKLARVQTAIAQIEEHGQSITEEGQTLTRADLNTLYRREERLEQKIERQSSGRIKVAEF